ncbi:hypothetical protein [Stutzerimonas xanthomarina]|uniref:hypothetical protein n=1 Tax=Stutzerimonas xanthomarina TaxID=271420 RepID=UPI003AA7B177
MRCSSRIARQAEQGISTRLHTVDGSPSNLRRVCSPSATCWPSCWHQLRRRPTPEQFCALDQVIVSPDGGGFHGATDDALATHGLQRRGAVGAAFPVPARCWKAPTWWRCPNGWLGVALQVVEAPLEIPG